MANSSQFYKFWVEGEAHCDKLHEGRCGVNIGPKDLGGRTKLLVRRLGMLTRLFYRYEDQSGPKFLGDRSKFSSLTTTAFPWSAALK